MRRSRWRHFLRESGLCIDSVRLLDWISTRGWARVLFFRFLRLRFSPAILENALSLSVGPEEGGRLYSLGMSHINVGDTYKTTASDRTTLADAELERLANEYEAPSVLEIGVSDGISALALLRKGDTFGRVLLTDRFPRFFEKPLPLGRVFLMSDGELLGVKVLCFYLCFGDGKPRSRTGYTPIETVNPVLRREFGIRTIQRFDMLRDQTDEPAALIKCANILNVEYFGERNIRQAAANLGRSLIEGGHIVVSQNNPKYRDGESLFVLRRQGARLILAHERNGHEAAHLFGQEVDLETSALPEGLRILFLAPSLDAGGAERQLVVLANALAARGHRVAVALHYPGGILESDLAGAECIQLRKRGRWDFGGFLGRLVRSVRGFDPDVVYSFLGTPNILTALLGPLLRPARVIWAVRASDMDMAPYGRVARFAHWLEARLSPLADVVIVNSHAGQAHALQRGFSARGMSVIPNGIDTGRFRPDMDVRRAVRQEWSVGSDQMLVGLMARLDPMKDIPTFFRAAAQAVRSDAALRFICVGAGPLDVELRSLAASLGLEDRLIWAGFRADAERVCNGFDMCVLSSRTEGFPNVLGEAMACSVPCVTTDVGDAALIVGDTGIVVPPGNPEALAAGILSMAGRIRRGDVAGVRERIKERFSVEAMVDATERLMGELACRV